MSSFKVKIVTAEKLCFEGDVDKLIVKTTEGDVGILAKHINYVAALGVGGLSLYTGNGIRRGAVSEGFITVNREETVVLANAFEWSDEIDANRAKEAHNRAEDKLKREISAHEERIATLKLKKAINRMRIAQD